MPRLTFFVELSLLQASPPYASNLAFFGNLQLSSKSRELSFSDGKTLS